MNRHVLRALMVDALHQVLDNRVFRILCCLAGLPVLASFLIGFREEEVVLLFGWRRVGYPELLGFLGGMPGAAGGAGLRLLAIREYQTLVVDHLSGTIGMALSIAATAFFVPRMTEKGAADTLFSKPVSRATLLLARYGAGLLFVALLSTGMLAGIWLGLRLVSGHGDAGIFWGAARLTYAFALVHTVSTLVGAWTRNTVASILVALIFFAGNGCVHGIWEVKGFAAARAEAQGVARDTDGALHYLSKALDTAHWVLPKTGDAPRLATLLRDSITARDPLFEDELTTFALFDLPPGWHAVELPAQAPDASEPVLFRAEGPDGWVELRRRRRLDERSLFDVIRGFEERAEADPAASPGRTRNANLAGMPAQFLAYELAREPATRRRDLAAFEHDLGQRDGKWYVLLETEVAAPESSESVETAPELAAILETAGFERAKTADPSAWYSERFAWDAPLAFNAWFSLGSSLAFALAMLLVSLWKLSRIDF